MTLKAAVPLRLDNQDAERVRRSQEERISQLQSLPASKMRLLGEVQLADGVATTIAHGLGRVPSQVIVSPTRGAVTAGFIDETRNGVDRSKFIVLTANDYGATVAVDVAVL